MEHVWSDHEMYMKFGYLPRFKESTLDWLGRELNFNSMNNGMDESWWAEEGIKIWKRVIANEIASTNANVLQVLSLSGGLDSRMILGGLLEHVPTSQLVVATYGIPGTWDYEIAKKIARTYGLRHEVFNLLDEDWDPDELLKSALRLKEPVSVHQSHIRQKLQNYFGSDCVYWSGFMGDSLAGIDLPKTPIFDRTNAVKFHLRKYPLIMNGDAPCHEELVEKIVSEFPWDTLNAPKLDMARQLDFGFRQRLLTRPIVLVEGFDFKTPFLNHEWVNFMLNVPYPWLLEKHLYHQIFKRAYVPLAALPVKTSAGMPINASRQQVFLGKALARVTPYLTRQDPYRSHPKTNYINWAESLRHRSKLQASVLETLDRLKQRALLDNQLVDRWWREHQQRSMDHSTLLMTLSSLDLLLQAGKIYSEREIV